MDGMAQPWTVRHAAYTATPKRTCHSRVAPLGHPLQDCPCETNHVILHITSPPSTSCTDRGITSSSHISYHTDTAPYLHTVTSIPTQVSPPTTQVQPPNCTSPLPYILTRKSFAIVFCSDFHKFCINLQTDTQVVLHVHTCV